MKWSLRTRLLLATLALVAFGLFVAGAATYGLLSSSLIARVDEQLERAGLPAARALFELGNRRPGRASELPFGRGGRGGMEFPGPRGPFRGHEDLPVTFFQILDPAGEIVASRSFGFGSEDSGPDLPEALPGSARQEDAYSRRFFSTDATGGSSLRFRVLAASLGPGRGTLVVAFPLADVDATLRHLLLVEGLVGLCVLVAVGVLAAWLVRLGLRPLTQMESTAAAIAGGDLSRRVGPADARTEVGRLALALNNMLERIETAFAERRASEERLRRFVADASHELRTPLTSIRGYAELFRRGAEARPEDLAKSMRRIEEEAARMGTLVEELLLLAKFDQGPALELRPVDLARIAGDAVADARAIQPERLIDANLAEGVIVEGDEGRLRQVAANLLANALEHTPRESRVHVSVSTSDVEAVFVVADEGPGLDPEHAGKVFNRFFRVDQARARDKGGAGLGLSIAQSIVQAHGGRIHLETSVGRGAAFSVTLPLAREAPDSGSEPEGRHGAGSLKESGGES